MKVLDPLWLCYRLLREKVERGRGAVGDGGWRGKRVSSESNLDPLEGLTMLFIGLSLQPLGLKTHSRC